VTEGLVGERSPSMSRDLAAAACGGKQMWEALLLSRGDQR
jgi:hypothetical protein